MTNAEKIKKIILEIDKAKIVFSDKEKDYLFNGKSPRTIHPKHYINLHTDFNNYLYAQLKDNCNEELVQKYIVYTKEQIENLNTAKNQHRVNFLLQNKHRELSDSAASTHEDIRVIIATINSVQEQVNEAIGNGFDGMIVYVDQAGKPPEFYTGGWKNRESKIPADAKSLFKIGSISKLYVAVAVTKLAHEGRLSLEKTLADYMPELLGRIENADKITLRMMVQHRSGIPNITDIPNFWENPPKNKKETLNLVLDLPANFKPDEDYEYSNTNYFLISEIIDKVLGYSHQQYIKEKILLPMELNNTFSSISEVNIEDVMSGYYVGVESDIKTNDYGLNGYGSMIATAEDVGIFLRALNDGSVFEEGEQEIYPYVYDHGGLLPGYQCLAEYHKDIDTVVVQFINTTNFDGYDWNLSKITINSIVKILRRNKADHSEKI